jgi:hypothetical protein
MIKLKLEPEVQKVILEGPQGPEEYELREMDAATRDDYLDQLARRMAVSPDGKIMGVRQIQGMQASLIARCLFRANGERVKEEEVQQWPASTVQALFETAQKMNHLVAEEGERKNV